MVMLGMNNSRMKDFFDLSVVARTSPLDGRTLVDAICATFARRNTSLPTSTSSALTTEFSSNPIKAQQWRAFVTKAGLQWTSLEEVVGALAVFLDPAIAACSLSSSFEPQWNPAWSEWGVGDRTSPRWSDEQLPRIGRLRRPWGPLRVWYIRRLQPYFDPAAAFGGQPRQSGSVASDVVPFTQARATYPSWPTRPRRSPRRSSPRTVRATSC